jgi:hypothetical protein
MNALSPELDLTIACIRRALDLPADTPRNVASVDREHWLSVINLHGVAPLAHTGLTRPRFLSNAKPSQ